MRDVASVDHVVHDVLTQLQTILLAQVTPLPDDPNTQQSGCLEQQVCVLGSLCREVISKSAYLLFFFSTKIRGSSRAEKKGVHKALIQTRGTESKSLKKIQFLSDHLQQTHKHHFL